MVVFSHESTIKFMSLRKNCPYSDLFWFVFSRIISPYSVRMPENMDQNNSEHRHFSRSMWVTCNSDYSLLFWSNWSGKATIHILIQLWNLEFQGNKKEILVVCVWYRKTIRTKTITTYPWVVNLCNWCAEYFIWHLGQFFWRRCGEHEGRNSYVGKIFL